MATPSTTRSTSATPAFTGTTIDRASELRADGAGIQRLLKHPRAAVLGASADSVLIGNDSRPRLPPRRPREQHEGGLAAYMWRCSTRCRPRFCANCGAGSRVAEAGLARRCSRRGRAAAASRQCGDWVRPDCGGRASVTAWAMPGHAPSAPLMSVTGMIVGFIQSRLGVSTDGPENDQPATEHRGSRA